MEPKEYRGFYYWYEQFSNTWYAGRVGCMGVIEKSLKGPTQEWIRKLIDGCQG